MATAVAWLISPEQPRGAPFVDLQSHLCGLAGGGAAPTGGRKRGEGENISPYPVPFAILQLRQPFLFNSHLGQNQAFPINKLARFPFCI